MKVEEVVRVLNGKTLGQVVKFRCIGVVIAATGSEGVVVTLRWEKERRFRKISEGSGGTKLIV